MAIETAIPTKKRAGLGSKNTGGLDLEDLQRLWLKPLWLVLSDAFTAEPNTEIVPHIWRWADVRPRMLEAGRRISAEEAERRVLMYLNPGLQGRPGATQTLVSGIQLIMPGEIAPTHRHVPSALRVVVEGRGAYTTVSGEKTLMRPGDFVTTPNWAWHDHGNETSEPMIWLDGLDMPFVLALNAMFYEELGEGYDIQPVTRVLDYVNPLTGGPTLPTMGAHAQLVRPGEHTRAVRDTASRIYHVLDGRGASIIGGK